MKKRSILIATTILTMAIPTSAAAANTGGIDRFSPNDGPTNVKSSFVPSSVDPDARVTVMVELAGDPVALVQAKAGRELSAAEKAATQKALKAKQATLKSAITAKGGKVLSQMQSAYNGMRITIARKQLASLAKLKGVAAVKPVPVRYLDNSVSVPYLGVPKVWENTGYTGENVKVGVLDTGIDYTHADFAGPGTVAAFEAAKATSTAPADPALFGPGAPRIKGGWDLVGDDYDANVAGSVPMPDPNPLDCNGHGTHVSGTIGGSGVNVDGSTYSGPYDTTTHNQAFKVGPGVAPEVDLYGYRVFGCGGSSSVVTEAIDRAVADGMDVINMSLGSPYGRVDDSDAIAATNAVAAGVVVVASAGNSGPNPYLVGSPSVGRGVISVAANDSTATFPGVELAFGSATVPAINANGTDPLPSEPFTVVVVADDPATAENESLGCSVGAFTKAGITTAAGDPKTIAVVKRGTCARVAKAVYGQQAGADAVVMINNATSYPPFEGAITSNPDTGEAYTVTIPFLGVRSTDGAALTAAGGTSLTMTAKALTNPAFTAAATFSSGGPRTGDSGAKPSVVAPGVSTVSAGVGLGSGSETLSGTSMAAPHVAGVAALTVQAHPAWSAGDLSAAVVSTADADKVKDYRLTLVGNGLVDTAQAVGTSVVAAGDSYEVGGVPALDEALSFGFAEPTSSFTGTKTVTLTNHGSSAATYAVSIDKTPQSRPSTVTTSASSVTVPAGGTATVDVTLVVPAGTVGSSLANPNDQFNLYEVSGQVTFTKEGSKLTVPYLLVPRAQANLAATKSASTDKSVSVALTNAGGALASSADFYTWGISDPQDVTVPQTLLSGMDLRAVGVQSFPLGSGDDLLVFAINNWTRHSNAASLEFDISIDKNNDGVADSILFTADHGLVVSGDTDGLNAAFLYDLKTGDLAQTSYLPVSPTDSSTLLVPIEGSMLYRGGKAGPIRYRVDSYDLVNNLTSDSTGWARYNQGNKAVADGAWSVVPVGGSDTVQVAVNSGQVKAQLPLGVMVVAFDNKAGADEARLVPLG